MRCFLAFEIENDLKDVISENLHCEAFEELKDCSRTVHRENWHCTVLFFRDLPDGKITQLTDWMREFPVAKFNEPEVVDWKQFERWKGLICLVGTSLQTQRLTCLKENLPPEILQFGQTSKLYDWKPHITVNRMRAKKAELYEGVTSQKFPLTFHNAIQSPFKRLSLFKSLPNEQTGVYERLLTINL